MLFSWILGKINFRMVKWEVGWTEECVELMAYCCWTNDFLVLNWGMCWTEEFLVLDSRFFGVDWGVCGTEGEVELRRLLNWRFFVVELRDVLNWGISVLNERVFGLKRSRPFALNWGGSGTEGTLNFPIRRREFSLRIIIILFSIMLYRVPGDGVCDWREAV